MGRAAAAAGAAGAGLFLSFFFPLLGLVLVRAAPAGIDDALFGGSRSILFRAQVGAGPARRGGRGGDGELCFLPFFFFSAATPAQKRKETQEHSLTLSFHFFLLKKHFRKQVHSVPAFTALVGGGVGEEESFGASEMTTTLSCSPSPPSPSATALLLSCLDRGAPPAATAGALFLMRCLTTTISSLPPAEAGGGEGGGNAAAATSAGGSSSKRGAAAAAAAPAAGRKSSVALVARAAPGLARIAAEGGRPGGDAGAGAAAAALLRLAAATNK